MSKNYLKNFIFVCRDTQEAENIINLATDIFYHQSEFNLLNPNNKKKNFGINFNLVPDYLTGNYLVHISTQDGLTSQEYSMFEYALEYLHIVEKYGLETVEDFIEHFKTERNKKGLLNKKINITKELALDKLTEEEFLHLVAFLTSHPDYLYEKRKELLVDMQEEEKDAIS